MVRTSCLDEGCFSSIILLMIGRIVQAAYLTPLVTYAYDWSSSIHQCNDMNITFDQSPPLIERNHYVHYSRQRLFLFMYNG